MRKLCTLALAASLSACATTGTTPPVKTQVASAVQRAADAWARIKATAALWLPLLPADRQAQVQSAIAVGDRAVLIAQAAATVAEASAALAEVNAAAGQVTAATR